MSQPRESLRLFKKLLYEGSRTDSSEMIKSWGKMIVTLENIFVLCDHHIHNADFLHKPLD